MGTQSGGSRLSDKGGGGVGGHPDPEIRGGPVTKNWGGVGGHPDPEIRGGPVSRNFFRPFGRPFGRKIRGAGPPGPSSGSATANQPNRLLKCKENHSKLSEIFRNITPHHFTWSSEPREGLACCSAKGVPSFLGYFKTLSIGPVPGIEPATSCSAVNTLYRLS